MARRITAGVGLALMLALALPIPAAAQKQRGLSRPGPGAVVVPPQLSPGAPRVRRGGPQLPNYYFERGGAVATPRGPVGQGDIASSLRSRGFRDIGPLQQRGRTSITEAVGPAGERVQLVIGPNGEIVGVRVLNPGPR